MVPYHTVSLRFYFRCSYVVFHFIMLYHITLFGCFCIAKYHNATWYATAEHGSTTATQHNTMSVRKSGRRHYKWNLLVPHVIYHMPYYSYCVVMHCIVWHNLVVYSTVAHCILHCISLYHIVSCCYRNICIYIHILCYVDIFCISLCNVLYFTVLL